LALTAKQQRFVDEYLIDLNATQAATRAGYSAKTAQQIGSRLLSNVVISTAVKKRLARASAVADLTLQSHLDTLNGLRDKAVSAEQFSAAVSAEVSRGKASGFYVDKHEHKHRHGGTVTVKIEREGRRRSA
jgi:phage terminase small subunit